MKSTVKLTLLAGVFAGSFLVSPVAIGADGLPAESGGSPTAGQGSHGTGTYDTNDPTRGTKGTNEHMRRNQPGEEKRQMGNGPSDQPGNAVRSVPDRPRGATGGESDDSD